MITWPAGLPLASEVEGYEETPPELALRSPMDAGPAKLRRRYSTGPTTWRGTLLCSPSQAEQLLGFWRTTLAGGALAFEWTHPRTGASAEMRFVSPPAIRHQAEGLWRVALEMELL